ncbi:hypothetical protein [Leifsonia virtsii]|uniref:Uncharacterized protein n=1 Tax=Leifsonia virtsii TaxID=3035915 RepID=A0ABT8J1L4_9MICO|nr:hypothetical protein [Leifsonia virtsii]MDN4598487.1 hypothetical protein [Leifsonia virtsii]
MSDFITPPRARRSFRHPENADLARPAVAALDEIASEEDDLDLEVCS